MSDPTTTIGAALITALLGALAAWMVAGRQHRDALVAQKKLLDGQHENALVEKEKELDRQHENALAEQKAQLERDNEMQIQRTKQLWEHDLQMAKEARSRGQANKSLELRLKVLLALGQAGAALAQAGRYVADSDLARFDYWRGVAEARLVENRFELDRLGYSDIVSLYTLAEDALAELVATPGSNFLRVLQDLNQAIRDLNQPLQLEISDIESQIRQL